MDNANNDKIPPDNQPGLQEEFRRYVLSNLLSVLWGLSLLVGGIIFWLYFSEIEYFPDLNFNESVLFFLVATFTGGTILLAIAFLFMSPYFMRWWIPLEKQKPNEISDAERIWYFFSIFLVCMALFLFFSFLSKPQYNSVSFLILIAVIFGHNCFYWQCHWLKKLIFFLPKKHKTEESNINELTTINMFLPWIMSVFVMPPIFLIISALYIEEKESNGSDQYLILISFSFFIILAANYAYALISEKSERTNWWLYILFPISIALVITLLATNSTYFPRFVMNKYKLGNFETEWMLVDQKGCQILDSLELTPDSAEKQDSCQLKVDNETKNKTKKIKILSRLGRSFYIETETEAGTSSKSIRFTIPSDQVLSWSINKPNKKTKKK